jgi:hypothetical protein
MRRALLAAVVLALSACGIDLWPYLDPPGVPAVAVPGTPLFEVIYQAPTIAEFRGFEVYYKFYNSEQPIQTGITTLEELKAAGFSRMCSPGTLTQQGLPFVPLIPVDVADQNQLPPNDTFTTVLDFWLSVPPYMVYGGSVPPANDGIRRIATDALSNTKTFEESELVKTDVDLANVKWDEVVAVDHKLTLVIYALSYGLYEINVPLYSTARYLGYMEYIAVP